MSRLLFLAPNVRLITGGTKGIFGFANAMCRRGHDVHVAHVTLRDPSGNVIGVPFDDVSQITWYPIDDRISQSIDGRPDADVVFAWDGQLPDERHGLPIMWIQAFGHTPGWLQEPLFAAACPKVCTSRWLRRVAIARGIPERQAVWIPYGLEHDRYQSTTPVQDRGPTVAYLYNSHFTKRPILGIDALVAAKQQRPDLEVIIFGNSGLCTPLPDWMEWRPDPPFEQLVALLNRSAVFLATSVVEGFGLAALEAMSCGCALVTTRNGGSDDYARDGETAIRTDGDAEAIARAIVGLLDDPQSRAAMAIRGMQVAAEFDWSRSGALLDDLTTAYLADPSSFMHPTGAARLTDAELMDPTRL